FVAGKFDTGFIERHLAALGGGPHEIDRAAAAAGAQRLLARERGRLSARAAEEDVSSPWDAHDGFQLSGARQVMAPLDVDGEELEVLVKDGDAVHKGQRLAVIEAMKMEHALTAPRDGVVAELRVSAGSQVAEGAQLMTIEPG